MMDEAQGISNVQPSMEFPCRKGDLYISQVEDIEVGLMQMDESHADYSVILVPAYLSISHGFC